MRRTSAKVAFLLKDERSAVRRKIAAVFALIVLSFVGAGMILTALGQDVHRGADRRVLIASEDLAGQPPV
jgi:hypothetical protein